MTLQQVILGDVGKYTCEISNHLKTISHTYELDVTGIICICHEILKSKMSKCFKTERLKKVYINWINVKKFNVFMFSTNKSLSLINN